MFWQAVPRGAHARSLLQAPCDGSSSNLPVLSFGIRIIGLLDLGRVLRCYVVHLGKNQILLFSKKKTTLRAPMLLVGKESL